MIGSAVLDSKDDLLQSAFTVASREHEETLELLRDLYHSNALNLDESAQVETLFASQRQPL